MCHVNSAHCCGSHLFNRHFFSFIDCITDNGALVWLKLLGMYTANKKGSLSGLHTQYF